MKTILIAEDRKEVRDLVRVTLRGGGFDIHQAADGLEAVEMARSLRPDLVLMDVMMPGEVDGVEATRILRSELAPEQCRILMLTAKGQQSDRRLGMDAGADDYFTKPFSPLELIKKVEEMLEVSS
jgi:DNA-binding response OmpR family regulator